MLDERRVTGSAAEAAQMLRQMMLIRAFDAQLPSLYTKGLIRGSSHAAAGQEAVAVGACAALRPDDYITSTHRGHGHTIAKGADVRRMMAELFGRANGYCRGKGGSMHIADFSAGMLGANGIVGGGFGLAAGASLSAKMRRDGRVALCFFGDGALNKGAFHEVANMAAIWKLPLVLLCENNQFAMSARVSSMTSVEKLERRACAFGFPGVAIDGMDVRTVRATVEDAVERARSGDGPSLIVATCYRFEGHFAGDLMRYRDRGEEESWRARDPITRLRDELIAEDVLTAEQFALWQNEAEATIARAVEFARESPVPEPHAVAEDVI